MSSTTHGPAQAPLPEPGMYKFGVALFDDEKAPAGAWIATNGSPAQRVDGTNQLATDTIWWTNISYNSFFRDTEAYRSPWLRHDAYLVLKPRDVLAEWGYDPASTPPDFAATFCSLMFSRVMTMAYRLTKEVEERVRMRTLFTRNTLREDLRRLLPPADYPKGEAAAVMKTGQAYAEFTRTSVRGMKGGRMIMLRCPRIAYAMTMLTTPVPGGDLEFMACQDMGTTAEQRVSWVRDTDNPCMVELTVRSMQPDAAPVFAFGNTTDRDRRTPRSWVSHPEFLAMNTFSELDVTSAYVGQQYSQLNLKLPEPVRRFLSDIQMEASWSAGVLAETIWRAACLSEDKSRQGNSMGEERAHTSWRGAWIKGADKTAGFLSAMRLADMGYVVSSYGYGWIFCTVTEDQIPDLLRDGLSIGLYPRLNDVPEGLFGASNATVPWGGDKRSRILAQLTATRQKNLLWNLDRLPLVEKSQRDMALKKMLAAHKSQQLS